MLAKSVSITVGTTAKALSAFFTDESIAGAATGKRYNVRLKYDDGAATNGGSSIVAVGLSGVTVTGTDGTNGEPLRPGDVAEYPNQEIDALYLVAGAAGQQVHVCLFNPTA